MTALPSHGAQPCFALALLVGFDALRAAASPLPVGARNGMVVTSQHLATKVGVDILKQGGNAVDAAVAVGYALGVVFPAAGNIGGGGFMTIQFADGRKTFIDFRETAPLAATANMYLDRDGNVLRGLSSKGYLAAGVPGNVAGFELALVKYGTMKRAAVMAPAIRLAKRGFVLEQGDVDLLAVAARDFREDAPSAAVFLQGNGQPYIAGQRLVQKDLARTLERIAKHGNAGFYAGPVADAIVAASTRGGGIITKADLARYQAKERAPIECDYRGYRIVSAPPPSSGGVIVCEILGHPRRLSAAGMGLPLRARRAPPDRGDAPRVRRSQQLPRRSRFRPQSRSSACWTRATPRRSAPPSIPPRPACRAT